MPSNSVPGVPGGRLQGADRQRGGPGRPKWLLRPGVGVPEEFYSIIVCHVILGYIMLDYVILGHVILYYAIL